MLTSIQKDRFEIESQGCRLRGFVLKPKRTGRMPAVIVSHGFGSCTRDTKKYAQVFVDEGYATICFDFCSYYFFATFPLLNLIYSGTI